MVVGNVTGRRRRVRARGCRWAGVALAAHPTTGTGAHFAQPNPHDVPDQPEVIDTDMLQAHI